MDLQKDSEQTKQQEKQKQNRKTMKRQHKKCLKDFIMAHKHMMKYLASISREAQIKITMPCCYIHTRETNKRYPRCWQEQGATGINEMLGRVKQHFEKLAIFAEVEHRRLLQNARGRGWNFEFSTKPFENHVYTAHEPANFFL